MISIKAIIFDLDGTLLDTLEDLANAANYMLHTLSCPMHDIPSYRYRVGNGIPALIARSLPSDAPEDLIAQGLAIFRERYKEHMLDCTKSYDGILPLLAELKARGIPVAIATNKDDTLAKSIARHYFPNTFSLVCGQTATGKAKPDPAIVHTIMHALCKDNEDIIYIGDSDVDMLTANNARVYACGATWGFRTGDELLNSGAKVLISSPLQLLQLL